MFGLGFENQAVWMVQTEGSTVTLMMVWALTCQQKQDLTSLLRPSCSSSLSLHPRCLEQSSTWPMSKHKLLQQVNKVSKVRVSSEANALCSDCRYRSADVWHFSLSDRVELASLLLADSEAELQKSSACGQAQRQNLCGCSTTDIVFKQILEKKNMQ